MPTSEYEPRDEIAPGVTCSMCGRFAAAGEVAAASRNPRTWTCERCVASTADHGARVRDAVLGDPGVRELLRRADEAHRTAARRCRKVSPSVVARLEARLDRLVGPRRYRPHTLLSTHAAHAEALRELHSRLTGDTAA